MFHWKGRRKDKDSPTPPCPDELKEYLEETNIKDRISDADFFKLVALPPAIDLSEWLATHTMSFFNHVNLLYGVVSEYCTAESCPAMTAPDNVQYFWYDDKGKKAKHTANQYIDYVLSHIQKLINDEAVFPTKFDQHFPADLSSQVRRIHRYLFHVLAHVYHAHYRLLHQLGLHGHLNTLFTHFMVFTSKFSLVEDKESDLLLQLFSLLLKSLADPSQNPTLREGLGLTDSDLDPEKAAGGGGDTDGQADTSSPTSSSKMSNGGSSVAHHCDTSQDSHHNSAVPMDAGSSSTSSHTHASQQVPPHPSCPSPSSSSSAASPSEHNNGGLPSSLQVISTPSQQQLSRGGGEAGDVLMDSESAPSEWLSNLQVSAT